ncbi:MAG: flagellar biosynthetic protein FliR [Fimbriimonadaceae bacterium]|nr:flagellar biosynthetic protein FliR [Fimbriimonadaceae bacterium]QYK58973.1 MAG: flagellar biosynthetic protein FliR [Fimbriimonadaceae bacterium]
MTLNEHTLIGCVGVFARCTALLLSAPPFGSMVPVNVRVLLSVVLALALYPVVAPWMPPHPDSLFGLFGYVVREAMFGLLIGGVLHLAVLALQMAGAFLDVQIGTASAQLFNPMLGMTSTPVSQLKMMLGFVVLFLLDAHHVMFRALVFSFESATVSRGLMIQGLLDTLSMAVIVSLQIAAPAVAVTAIVDLSAGVVNKAVPQTQPFLLSLPFKLGVGIFMISIGLPILVGGVQTGIEGASNALMNMLRGGS